MCSLSPCARLDLPSSSQFPRKSVAQLNSRRIQPQEGLELQRSELMTDANVSEWQHKGLYLTYSSSSWITGWKWSQPSPEQAGRNLTHSLDKAWDILGNSNTKNHSSNHCSANGSSWCCSAEPLLAASQILAFQLNISWATTIKIIIWKLQNHQELQEIPAFHCLKEKQNL